MMLPCHSYAAEQDERRYAALALAATLLLHSALLRQR